MERNSEDQCSEGLDTSRSSFMDIQVKRYKWTPLFGNIGIGNVCVCDRGNKALPRRQTTKIKQGKQMTLNPIAL